MADNKLRLAIVTSLDNSGIKATKEQIDSLEQSINKLNNSANGGGSGGGSDGGIFGKMGGQAAGLAKRALGVIGILRTIGSLTNEIIKKATVDGKGWGEAFTEGAKSFMVSSSFAIGKMVGLDFQAMLDEATSKMKAQVDKLALGIKKYYNNWQRQEDQLMQTKIKSHAVTMKSIEQENQLYKKQLSIVHQINGNVDSTDQLILEHRKQQALETLRNEGGTDEQLEQLSRAWDLRIAQEMEETKVSDIQNQREQFELGVAMTKKKIDANVDAIREQWKLQARYKDTIANARAIENQDEGTRQTIRDYKKRLADSQQLVLDLRRENRGMLDTISPEMLAWQRQNFDMQEAQARAAASLSTRKMYYDYDNYVGGMQTATLDLLPENFGSEMAEQVEKNFWALQDIVENTENLPRLGEKIDQLLQMK